MKELNKEDAERLLKESRIYSQGHSDGFNAGFQSCLETILRNQEKGELNDNDKGKAALDSNKVVTVPSK